MESLSGYIAEILKLLGQEIRIRIVESLRDNELYVSQIFPLINQEQSNTSRHLSLMTKNGILGYRPDAQRKSFYRIKLDGVVKIIDLARKFVAREGTEQERQPTDALVAEVLKEISQPTRLAIIAGLRDKELSVTEIFKIVGKERTTTSRHLSGMVELGIVTRRFDGVQAHYRLKHLLVLEIVDLTQQVVEQDTRKRQEALLVKA